jgi:hypothetical protein
MVKRRLSLTARQVEARQEALNRAKFIGTCECRSESHISHPNSDLHCTRKFGNGYHFVPGDRVACSENIAVICSFCYREYHEQYR